MRCRVCGNQTDIVVDLGPMPLANRLMDRPDSDAPRFPLAVEMCGSCGNLQLSHCVDPVTLYADYLYVTPDSTTLSQHYDTLIAFMTERGYADRQSFLFEFGSNIGRFLAHARPTVGRVLGLDPANAIVAQANAEGIPTICDYFSPQTATRLVAEHGPADLVVARHCAAHNADVHALVEGARQMMGSRGIFAMENAYALDTVVNREIGQIYHEHMFYHYARPVQHLFADHGLELVDLMPAPVHGGSMVFFGAPAGTRPVSDTVARTIEYERTRLDRATLDAFAAAPEQWARDCRMLIEMLRGQGARVALYGASAKATTLINLAGIDTHAVIGCADSTAVKIGRYIPGTAIQIRPEAEMIAAAPDFFVITAPNYADEIVRKVRSAGNNTSRFYTVFPSVGAVEESPLFA